MLRLLKKWFPIRAESMNAFIDLVKIEGCRTVQILPVERDLGTPGVAGCSLFIWVPSNYEYIGTETYLLYSASTMDGRAIKYIGDVGAEYNQIGAFGEAAREKRSLELYFKEEQQARYLRRMLCNVTIEELDYLGVPITQVTRKDIHRQAVERGLSPLP